MHDIKIIEYKYNIKGNEMLYIVSGLPGTGKSAAAKELAAIAKAALLRTDETRKKAVKKPKYTAREKEKVYETVFKAAESMLRAKKNVVIDATFHREAMRNEALKVARKAGSGIIFLEVVCDEPIVKKRIGRRRHGHSDADFKVYTRLRKEWEPIKGKRVIVDSSLFPSAREWKNAMKALVKNERKLCIAC